MFSFNIRGWKVLQTGPLKVSQLKKKCKSITDISWFLLFRLFFCFSDQMFLSFHFLFCITLIIYYLSQNDSVATAATKWPCCLDWGTLEESSDLSRIKTGRLKGCVWVRGEITHLSFGHHVLVRLQVESKGLPHLSDAVVQNIHLHHVLLVPFFELKFCTHGHKESRVWVCACARVKVILEIWVNS